MNILKLLIIGTLSISGITRAEEGSGGQGGGGGFSRADYTLEENVISAAIDEIKPFMKAVLWNYEILYHNSVPSSDPNINNTYRALFGDHNPNTNVYHILDQVSFQKHQGPCYTRTGTPVDASVEDPRLTKPNEICMSTSRIASKTYSEENAVRKLVGLFGHELVHLAGITSEVPAELFQSGLDGSHRRYSSFILKPGIELGTQFDKELADIEDKLRIDNQRPALLDKLSYSSLCQVNSVMFEGLLEMQNYRRDYSYFDFKGQWLFQKVLIGTSFSLYSCFPENDLKELLGVTNSMDLLKLLTGKTHIRVSQFWQMVMDLNQKPGDTPRPKYQIMAPNDHLVPIPKNGNIDSLRSVMKELLNDRAELLKQIKSLRRNPSK